MDAAAPHILAVDDSPEVLGVFRLLLEEEGYRVSTLATRFVDSEGVRDLRPDLVILDYLWGSQGDGLAMVELLRADQATAGTPIVLCTGAKREVEALGDGLGRLGVSVVLKPFDIDELLGVVGRGVGRAA